MHAAEEWAIENGYPMYDLGGGESSPDGYIIVDMLETADLVCDIGQGLPLDDDSVGVVRAKDFLEHIPHCYDSMCRHEAAFCTVGLMNEIYRVLVPGGWLLSMTPSTGGRGAFQDPTHCSFWNPNSFWYYTREEQARFVPGITARFEVGEVWEAFPSEWHEVHDILYVYANLRKPL